MAYHQFANETEHFGSFETFFEYDCIYDSNCRLIGNSGWYWHSCQPGCLPEGDRSGPFKSEQEAIKDATDFI